MLMKRYFICTFILWSFFTTSNAQLFDLLGKQGSIEIPFVYESNFIIVKLKINGAFPLNFIFDTGAEHTLLFKRTYTDLMGAKYEKKIKIYGSDMQNFVFAHIVRNMHVTVPPIDPIRMDFLVMENDYLKMDQLTGLNIDGILGAQFFKHHVVKIDYRRGVLTLYKKEKFPTPGKRYKSMPTNLKRNKPYVSASSFINPIDSADLVLLLDTGAGIGLMLHSNTHEQIELPEDYIQTNLGLGIGGQINGYLGRVAKLNFSAFSFTNVIAAFQDIANDRIANESIYRNGIIGNQILSRFTVIIDYPRSKIYLRPEKRIKQSFEYDKSGLTLSAAGPYRSDFRILYIIPNSPADQAGLEVGDRILGVKGVPATFLSLSKLTRIFRGKVGKSIRMKIRRGDDKIRKKFILEDLI